MVRSTFAGFNMASLALSASQRAIDVTGQNLSNINTQGYTRQRLDQISLDPVGPSFTNSSFSSKVGQGVMMTGVSQIRDPFLDIQYRSQLPKVGTADAMDAVLAQIGQIFDETDKDAVSAQFKSIISQLQNLSKGDNTGTVPADTVVRSACEVLLNTIRQNGIEIQGVYDTLKTKLNDNVIPEINKTIQDIVDKNIAIKQAQVLGSPALELMDSRNELIDSLATYFPIEATYEKQDLGGGIVVDVLNIDVRLADGTKVRLVEDNRGGEVNLSKYQEDGNGHKAGDIVEPIELYFKTAEENPKTYGGGMEALKKELPNEINSYLDDIAELNESILKAQDRIAQLQTKITDDSSATAKTYEDRINSYLDTIEAMNTAVNTANTKIDTLNTDITTLNTTIDTLRTQIKAETDAQKKAELNAQLTAAKKNLQSKQTELNAAQNERTAAQNTRYQNFSKIEKYLPGVSYQMSAADPNFMEVNLNSTDAAGNAVSTSLIAANVKTHVAVSNVLTTNQDADVQFTAGGVTAPASKTVNSAVNNAISDTKKQIAEIEAKIKQYEKDRVEKVDELRGYFPDNTLNATLGPDNVMTVTLVTGTAASPNDPVLVSRDANGSVKGSVSVNTTSDPATLDVTGANQTMAANVTVAKSVLDRITVSINDNLSEGVLKGDLDMLNKAEVFDVDLATGAGASDTKGIQYYQKMLDTFVNEFASTMNILNMTEEVPLVDKDGKPVMETVNGKEQQKTEKVIKPGNALFTSTDTSPEMAPLYIDQDGNWTTEATYTDADGNEQDNKKAMVPEMDGNGNVLLNDDGTVKYTSQQAEIPVNFTATTIKVYDGWMKGEVRINTAKAPLEGGNSTDNWNVNKMIEALSTQTHSFVDPKSGEVFKGTLDECYVSIQDTQAIERQATSRILETRTTVLNQIADDKDSVSGVWMDEEVMSLMKYSQSYKAASRLMTVMDEILERLITQTGVCGR